MIVRIRKRTNPYAQIDKRPLENETLSWKAKGLLAYLLAKPDDWEIRMEQLASASSDGLKAVRSALAELKAAGHAELKVVHEGGRAVGKRWVVKELASDMPETVISEKASEITNSVTSPKGHATNNKKQGTENELLRVESGLPPPLNTPEVEAAWKDWEQYKIGKRQKLTADTKNAQIEKLRAMGAARALAALRHSICQGYTGIFEPSGNQRQQTRPTEKRVLTKENVLR